MVTNFCIQNHLTNLLVPEILTIATMVMNLEKILSGTVVCSADTG